MIDDTGPKVGRLHKGSKELVKFLAPWHIRDRHDWVTIEHLQNKFDAIGGLEIMAGWQVRLSPDSWSKCYEQ